MQTLHLHFGCKDEYMPKEQQRLRFALVKRAALDYGPVWATLLTDSQQSGVCNVLLLHGLIWHLWGRKVQADKMKGENKIKLEKKYDFVPFHLWLIIKKNRFPDWCGLSSSVSMLVCKFYLQERPKTDRTSQTLICQMLPIPFRLTIL